MLLNIYFKNNNLISLASNQILKYTTSTCLPRWGGRNFLNHYYMSNRSFFCVSYSTLACTNRSGVLSHKQPCRGYPVGAPKFYLGTFKNAASSRCTSGVAMNYICRNFSLFIDRSSTRGRSCNTLRPGGGGLPLPHAFNKNSNTFISSTTNNSLFLVSKRHSSDGRPFYESDEVAFVVAAVGIPWILYNVYRQIMINRYASDYNSKHYDPAKKSPEEKYAKDSKFKFRPRKLRPVQVKIRDRLLPDDYTYISKVDGKEKPMDWIGIIKRKKKRVIERKKKKVESYSWPFCTPRKVREYDRLITIGEEWRRMGYEIDLSPVTDIPRRERTKFEKAVDRLVFNYFKWCTIIATLCVLEPLVQSIFFPQYPFSFFGERAFMNQWWNQPFSDFITKTAESPTWWLRACDYVFWDIHYLAEIAQNIIPHFCSKGHLHWYCFSEPIDSSESWFGPLQDWRGENGGLQRFINYVNWYWYMINTSFFIPPVIGLLYFALYCLACIEIALSEAWKKMFPEDMFVTPLRRSIRVFFQLPLFFAAYCICLVAVYFIVENIADLILDWLQTRNDTFYGPAYREKIYFRACAPISSCLTVLYFILLYYWRVDCMANQKKILDAEFYSMRMENIKQHRIDCNRAIRRKMRALADEYDFLESLGNVYDDGPENVEEKNLEAIRIRHVHALVRKRQLAGFFEPDTDTWSGKFQKYYPWSLYNQGIKNIELTDEESSALYREQLDLRTLIEREMKEDEKAELRLELKRALAGYKKLLQEKVSEQKVFREIGGYDGQLYVLQMEIDNINYTIFDLCKAIDLEKSGLFDEPRDIWNKIKKNKF